MFDLENYKDNLEVNNNNVLNSSVINKSLIYNGTYKKKNKESIHGIPPLAASIIGRNNTAALVPETTQSDLWTDIDVQESYLKQKPTCYLILGKPGAGSYSLGEAISKELKCIHLCPKNVLFDEIEQESPTGKCIIFNLRQQKAIKFDVILSIIKTKLESPVVKHRGYVISGIPMVTSDVNPFYYSNSLYAEEALQTINDIIFETIIDFKKKKIKKPNTGSHSSLSSAAPEEEVEEEHQEEIVDEEVEQPVELPKFLLDSCSGIIISTKMYMTTKKTMLLKQWHTILNLPLKPDIIIYLSSTDKDITVKKRHKYYDYINNVYTHSQLLPNFDYEFRWPPKYSLSDYISPFDISIFNPKYNCRHPISFEKNTINQLCNYKQHILPSIEEKIKDFKPKNVIKLNAQHSVHQMMHNFKERMILLPKKPVLIPEPLYLEEPPDDIEEFWKLVEELNVIKSGVLTFNRRPSLWYSRCPVELKQRRSTRGHARYAVSFFKHVYVLSSLNNMISFCRNPRPYLHLKFLQPTCRIIVMGTKSSGKTMISNCLSWLFDTTIISFDSFLQSEKEKKHAAFSKSILSEIIATIEDSRLAIWQNLEAERVKSLNDWILNVSKSLANYIPIYIEILKSTKHESLTEEEEEEHKSEPDLNLLNNYNVLRTQLSFLPFIEDVEKCINVLNDDSLITFAPFELITITKRPSVPVIGDQDVTEAITNYIITNELQKEIEPTNEELMNEFTNILIKIDEESQQISGNYGTFIIDGFPADPEFWDYLNEVNLLPDYTISLIENKEIDHEILQEYNNIQGSLKNYQERFSLADDPLIKTKLLYKNLPNSTVIDIQIIVQDYIITVLDFIFNFTDEKNIDYNLNETDVNIASDLITSFTASIEKYREDWDSVKLKLEEKYKTFIEVELQNKSDIQVMEEVLLKLRKSYCLTCDVNDNEESTTMDDEDESPKNFLTYNDPRTLCETGIYCPVVYYDYGVLWEGKTEFCIKYDYKTHFFSKEECFELFQKDFTRYQEYNKPFKSLPPLRLCIIGCIGSGKSSLAKLIAKELGLIHLDWNEIINEYLIPKHFKKVGRQYENSFTDTPIDEEDVMDFQMDEENANIISDILGNETELRRMVFNYFERGSPILSALMIKILKKVWFESPFSKTGFVLDGYPRIPSDVEDMIACYCIPDLIIELEGSIDTSLLRLSQKMYKTWKSQLYEAKNIAKLKLDKDRQDWMKYITKSVVVKLILEDILDIVFPAGDDLIQDTSGQSIQMNPDQLYSSSVHDIRLEEIYSDMIQEYPEPVDNNEWEKPDEARNRIDSRIEGVYEVEDEGLQSLKDILLEHKIKIFSINCARPLNKIFRDTLFSLGYLRKRCDSFFEQTFIVSCDIAEMLLLGGFYFYSKFNRMCPVYTYENPDTILNPFKIMKRTNNVYPVIHRSYVYFTFTQENLIKFRSDPLKYINSHSIEFFLEYPLTISVIGPPKSGKSILAQKLAKRYGLMCLSRGMALRYILEHTYWTELGSQFQKSLSAGDCLNSTHIIKAIQNVAIDHRTVTSGFVFDGFPETASEAMDLVNAGLYPTFVIDILNDKRKSVENSHNEIYYDIIKRIPPYSASFIEFKYMKWQNTMFQIRNWIKNDIQNISEINGTESRWQCLQVAVNHIDKVIPKIHNYLINVSKNIVSANGMCISNETFEGRMSIFKDLCPVCLHLKKLRHSGYPVNKKGVVQFENKFYWVCDDHMNLVMKFPTRFLTISNTDIPELPAVVKTINMSLVYETGICIVTYAHNLPSQKIVSGNNKFAASFRGKTYLFCSSECLTLFLAKPHMYYNITVFKSSKTFPSLNLKSLPNIGYLEQTIGNIITNACCAVNVMRPKYPGLSIQTSALLYIALYLKTHNPSVDSSILPRYIKASKLFDARCKLMIDIGLRLRSMDNPFAKYPKCCEIRKHLDSGTVRKTSSVVNDSSIISTAVGQ